MNDLHTFFESVYYESYRRQHLFEDDNEAKIVEWTSKMKSLKTILKAEENQFEIEIIPFTRENFEKLGDSVQSPIEIVFINDKDHGEDIFHKLSRKQGGKKDIKRSLLLGAIKPVLENPIFIIEHQAKEESEKINDTHLYFRGCKIMGKSYVVLAVVSLGFTNPLLISIYNIDDFYKKVSEGDLIVYENGQQVKERLLKETPKP